MKQITSFFNNITFSQFVEKQMLAIMVMGIFGIILTHKSQSIMMSSIAMLGIALYMYVFHLSTHYLEINMDTNVLVSVAFILLYLGVHVLNIKFIPNILIFYMGLIYISINAINYTIVHLGKKHSGTTHYNFGSDTFDHLFGINNSATFENFNHILPNILGSFLIIYAGQWKKWIK